MSFSQKLFFQIIRSWIHDLGTTRRTSSPGPRVSPRASSPSSESPGELYHWPVIITLANFRRIPHFLQNRHFERSPFAVSLYLTFGECPRYSYFCNSHRTPLLSRSTFCWLFGEFLPFLAVFTKFAIFFKIATLKGDPGSFYLTFYKGFGELSPFMLKLQLF